ncbi:MULTISPECIES: bifunctional diguanylate cyclase/phosphodiesterase [Aliiglaciecola]|uniref:bifunctional diguanylate cyclase/phosphodiesterase n=1 Tax=Aliiglaciecola TaxID=1406885 RepID=UPI001C080987|nr:MULTISPECIES: EAL domain-containing protein [Aliiglaciecola]MBU2878616.1 EAL domain-containing protein [Aliiglaciecola lipolytica]MDO6709555.1 EAL domain-containing protein [Aliiglaciecola sp. 2_MG-2023]MDO6750903.1 EAL domain-containing protein [Aliiglaciecola sp. 1_MG-2023]
MSPTDYENDELIFLEEDESQEQETNFGRWNVLVVDDDEEIHSVTRLALSDLQLNDKKLHFHHAYSGEQALTIIEKLGSKLAIILLDVVMETDDAGLVVARKMREELKLMEPRIILRTGQPGYAPEESVIKEYDINDYKTKTELTRSKLVTTIIASLRSYQQILTINQSRQGLEKIIHSSANLLEEHSVKGYCEGIVTQISSLIGLDAGGVVCARAGAILDKEDNSVYVLGAAGEFAKYINESLDNLHDKKIVDSVSRCLSKKQHLYEDNYSVLYLNSSGYDAAVFLNAKKQINSLDRKLLEVFLHSISIGYENVNLFHQLRTAAFKDWLTKLPNRNEFINMLDETAVMTSTGYNVVALLDIKHFSDVNDGLGQDAGNNLLKAVSKRVQDSLGANVRMGRIGADVFGLIGSEEVVNPERVNALFAFPFKAGDHTLPINITMGFCKLVDDECSGINLLKQTNIALNRAKKDLNTNFGYYEPEMEEKTTWRLGLIRQLRTDFSARKLEVWYQPQVDLVTERVVGMEALLRWPTENEGFISPAVFVPLAEYSGLIIEIGAWVLEESCCHLKELINKGYTDLRMAVNISMPQFRDPDFIQTVKTSVNDNSIVPAQLELEITESVVMDEPQIVVESLKELKEFGVKIAIDDFGTGFSSMSYLQQLPLDRLKVDRSFINEIKPNKSAFIAETIVTLGNRLGLQTIAEGVEKREQASYMLKLGCDEAQGYLYAKPMAFDELVKFLDSYQ